MSDINHLLPSRLRKLTLSLAAIGSLASCDSVIYDDEGDCSVHYRISFRYIKNMLGADAFGPQVTDINLQIYDQHGNLVLSKSEKRTPTETNDYWMEVELLPAPTTCWHGARANLLIRTPPISTSQATAEENLREPPQDCGFPIRKRPICRQGHNTPLPRIRRRRSVSRHLRPSGHIPLYLTKDTNHITVLIQNLDGSDIDENDFSITLEADNSVIEWDNDVAETPKFVYKPWWQQTTVITTGDGTEDFTESRASGQTPDGEYHGLMAEMTTSRMLCDREQYLNVAKAETGETLIRIPLIQYLLLVKGKYPNVKTDQDYLDAYDDFSLMFFLSEGGTWIKSRVIINGWRIVPPQDTELGQK